MQDTAIQFSDLALNSAILSALTEMGFVSPTPIQAAAIPVLLEVVMHWVKRKQVRVKQRHSHCLC